MQNLQENETFIIKILIYLEKNKLNRFFNKISREMFFNNLILHKKQDDSNENTLSMNIIESKNY